MHLSSVGSLPLAKNALHSPTSIYTTVNSVQTETVYEQCVCCNIIICICVCVFVVHACVYTFGYNFNPFCAVFVDDIIVGGVWSAVESRSESKASENENHL